MRKEEKKHPVNMMNIKLFDKDHKFVFHLSRAVPRDLYSKHCSHRRFQSHTHFKQSKCLRMVAANHFLSGQEVRDTRIKLITELTIQ